MYKEIEIPEGYEARIEGSKVVFVQKENEDERVRKSLINYVYCHGDAGDFTKKEFIAYLEKQKEQKPNIELIQRSWYLEGYHDRKFGKEPKWIIKTGEGAPEYEENPKYGQMLKEQKLAEMDNEEIELSDFESELFSAFSDGWQQYLHGEEVDVAQWAKEHSTQLLNAAKQELKLAKWSEEDETMRKRAICACNFTIKRTFCETHYGEARDWLKSLPIGFITNPNYNSDMVELLVSELQTIANDNGVPKQYDAEIAWLKSLRPQPHWKPSEEQMEALKHALGKGGVFNKEALEGLYEQLKKL